MMSPTLSVQVDVDVEEAPDPRSAGPALDPPGYEGDVGGLR